MERDASNPDTTPEGRLRSRRRDFAALSTNSKGSDSRPLDLGPHSRQRPSTFQSMCLTITLFAFAVYAGVTLLLRDYLSDIYDEVTKPHRALYTNPPRTSSNNNEVVRPLIGESDTFDIAVSVWIRETLPTTSTEKPKGDVILDKFGATVVYRPLYSNIAFRGLRLDDKHKTTSVYFRMPTDRFRAENLTTSDLLGAFVLIPSQDISAFRHGVLTNFSEYMPDEVVRMRPRRRAYPFPLGLDRSILTTASNPSLEDMAWDSFGVTQPLLHIQSIPSRCSPHPTPAEGPLPATPSLHEHGDDDEVGSSAPSTKTAAGLPSQRPVYERHPHIITRSQIRIIPETRLLGRQAYDRKHEKIKSTACLPPPSPKAPTARIKPHHKWCQPRSYSVNGLVETRLEFTNLAETDASTNEGQSELKVWYYPPYLDLAKDVAGPMDLLPIPVNREVCLEGSSTKSNSNPTHPTPLFNQDEPFMDVTWHISFTSRTPMKHWFSDLASVPMSDINHSASAYARVQSQDGVDMWNGIRGFSFREDAHPRRRLFLWILFVLTKCTVIGLDYAYWGTRTSSFGISVFGTYMDAIRRSIFIIQDIRQLLPQDLTPGKVVLVLVLVLYRGTILAFKLSRLYLELRVIARIEIGWEIRRTIRALWPSFTIKRSRTTHRERASERLEDWADSRVKIAFFIALCLIQWLTDPAGYAIIPAAHPLPVEEDVLTLSPSQRILDSVTYSLWFMHLTFQAIMNHKAGRFAGMHCLPAYLSFAKVVARLSGRVTSIVGYYEARTAITVKDAIDFIFATVFAVQVVFLPQVSQTQEDEVI